MSDDRDKIRQMPCAACGSTPSDPAHIKSRGAGGSNEEHNLMPLCRHHHRLSHDQGWNSFALSYSKVMRCLYDKGWCFEKLGGIHKLRRRYEDNRRK